MGLYVFSVYVYKTFKCLIFNTFCVNAVNAFCVYKYLFYFRSMETYKNKTAVIKGLIAQCTTKMQSEAIEVNNRFANYARTVVFNHNANVDDDNKLSVQYTGGKLIVRRKHHTLGQLIEDVRFKEAYDIVSDTLYVGNECTAVEYDKVRSEFQRILNELKPRIKKEAP